MSEPVAISWLPPRIRVLPMDVFDVEAPLRRRSLRWRCQTPRVEHWPVVGEALRGAATRLREMRVADVVSGIDRVAELWCDRNWPCRKEARDEVVRATGFSPEAVDRSFDLELRNYRADSLWRVLCRELGDPMVLDCFRPDIQLGGHTHAIGPRITLEVFTGNVPGLPALGIVRALLVKSAVIAKVASGEPTFAARFVESLANHDTRFGDAILVTYWDRDDPTILRATVEQADAVIAYGGTAACRAVRDAVPEGKIYVEHGHKFSIGLVSTAYLEKVGLRSLARRIADDVATFNQHACIAPQVYFSVGSVDAARAVAEEVAHALGALAKVCPLGELSLEDASALQLRRAAQAWRAASKSTSDLWQDSSLEWSVALDDELPQDAGGGNRFIRIVPVGAVSDAVSMLAPYARYLQNVALGLPAEDFQAAAVELARLGATRICEPGRMAEPSMMWRHDGRMCVSELLRWCDTEMVGT